MQTGTTTEPNNPGAASGTPLFALYRVQYALVPDNTRVNWAAAVATTQLGAYPSVFWALSASLIVASLSVLLFGAGVENQR